MLVMAKESTSLKGLCKKILVWKQWQEVKVNWRLLYMLKFKIKIRQSLLWGDLYDRLTVNKINTGACMQFWAEN